MKTSTAPSVRQLMFLSLISIGGSVQLLSATTKGKNWARHMNDGGFQLEAFEGINEQTEEGESLTPSAIDQAEKVLASTDASFTLAAAEIVGDKTTAIEGDEAVAALAAIEKSLSEMSKNAPAAYAASINKAKTVVNQLVNQAKRNGSVVSGETIKQVCYALAAAFRPIYGDRFAGYSLAQ